MAKTVLIPIADGTEELEAVALIDTLRRAGATVTVASVEAQREVTTAHAANARPTIAHTKTRGEIRGNPAAQRISHQRGFWNVQDAHQLLEEVDERPDLVIDQRLARLAEANLVEGKDVVLFRKCGDVHHPTAGVGA